MRNPALVSIRSQIVIFSIGYRYIFVCGCLDPGISDF